MYQIKNKLINGCVCHDRWRHSVLNEVETLQEAEEIVSLYKDDSNFDLYIEEV